MNILIVKLLRIWRLSKRQTTIWIIAKLGGLGMSHTHKKPIRPMQIMGSGHYLPPLEVPNEAFAQIVETSDEWIRTRTGIESRHLSEGEGAWLMGVKAAQQALEDAKLSADELDMIIVTTVTPDYTTPNTACIIQGEIGAKKAFCMDVNVACSGFVYALDMASRYLQDPKIEHVLIVSTERLSGITDYQDRSTCVLFGDGAAAVLLGKGDGQQGLLAVELGADGENGGFLTARITRPFSPFGEPGRTREPRFAEAKDTLQMAGREVFRFAVSVMSDAVERVLEEGGCELQDLQLLVPHQANNRILEAAMKRLNLPMELCYAGLERIGNTSSVSIPLGLDICRKNGRMKAGDLVAICGFGGGLSYGAALLLV